MGGSSADTLYGLGGDDWLAGNSGNDTLAGGRGDDTLIGNASADMLDGRVDAAADLMLGGADGDIYLFGRGSGADKITEAVDAVSTDILRLDSGIAPGDVVLLRSMSNVNDLVLQIVGTTDQITITNAYTYPTGASTAQGVERIEFADGTVTARNDDGQRVDLLHRKRILTCQHAGCYRSAYRMQDANTQWRLAA